MKSLRWMMLAGLWALLFAGPLPAQTLPRVNVSSGAVTVAQAGNTVIMSVQTTQIKRIFVQCVVAGQDLDAFIVSAKSALAPAVSSLYSTTADYTSPTGILIGTSGDLSLQAAGTTGWFLMDISAIDQITISASSGNAAGSTVTCYAAGGAN